MAPRRKAALSAPLINVSDLPDACLESILGCLPLADRFRQAALVCRRWNSVANSPALCRSLKLCYEKCDTALPRLRALANRLGHQGAGAHVERMDLCVDLQWDCGILGPTPAHLREVRTLCCASLAACTALQRLSLTLLGLGACDICSWVLRTPRLHFLNVFQGDNRQFAVHADLRQLVALRELRVQSAGVVFKGGGALPPSLTKLKLEGDRRKALLPEVSALTSLAHLSLHSVGFLANGYAALARLPALRSLDLDSCRALPDNLAALPALESLRIAGFAHDSHPNAEGRRLHAALPQLTGLTALCMSFYGCFNWEQYMRPPPALAALTRLRRLVWRCSEMPFESRLPPGLWLEVVERLAATDRLLVDSTAALAGATRLRRLAVQSSDDGATADVLRWAARLSSLRRLDIELEVIGGMQDVLNGAFAVQRRRPDVAFAICSDAGMAVWGGGSDAAAPATGDGGGAIAAVSGDDSGSSSNE